MVAQLIACTTSGDAGGDVDSADMPRAFPIGAVEAAEVVAWVRIADPVLHPCTLQGCDTDEVLKVQVLEILKGSKHRDYVALAPTREHRNSIHMLGNGAPVDALVVARSADILLGDGMTLAYQVRLGDGFEFAYLHPSETLPRQIVRIACLDLLGYNGREPTSTNQAGKTLYEQMLEDTTCNYPLDRALQELHSSLEGM